MNGLLSISGSCSKSYVADYKIKITFDNGKSGIDDVFAKAAFWRS